MHNVRTEKRRRKGGRKGKGEEKGREGKGKEKERREEERAGRGKAGGKRSEGAGRAGAPPPDRGAPRDRRGPIASPLGDRFRSQASHWARATLDFGFRNSQEGERGGVLNDPKIACCIAASHWSPRSPSMPAAAP